MLASDRNRLRQLFGEGELLPLWIAEPYVPLARPLRIAIERRASSGWYGYETRPGSVKAALWMAEVTGASDSLRDVTRRRRPEPEVDRLEAWRHSLPVSVTSPARSAAHNSRSSRPGGVFQRKHRKATKVFGFLRNESTNGVVDIGRECDGVGSVFEMKEPARAEAEDLDVHPDSAQATHSFGRRFAVDVTCSVGRQVRPNGSSTGRRRPGRIRYPIAFRRDRLRSRASVG